MTDPQLLPGTDSHSGILRVCRIIVQVEEPDAGLQQHCGVLYIDCDLLHAREIQNDGAGHDRRRGAIPQVLAATHGPDGHAVRGGDPDQRLHLFGRSRRHRREGPMPVRIDGEMVAVGVAILFGANAASLPTTAVMALRALSSVAAEGVCGVQVACLVDVMTRARIITLVSGTGTLRIRKS